METHINVLALTCSISNARKRECSELLVIKPQSNSKVRTYVHAARAVASVSGVVRPIWQTLSAATPCQHQGCVCMCAEKTNKQVVRP